MNPPPVAPPTEAPTVEDRTGVDDDDDTPPIVIDDDDDGMGVPGSCDTLTPFQEIIQKIPGVVPCTEASDCADSPGCCIDAYCVCGQVNFSSEKCLP